MKEYKIHNEKEIKGFFDEYEFLSNYFPCVIEFGGDNYPSVECAFQAAKLFDTSKRKPFMSYSSAVARKQGRLVQLRIGWEEMKLGIMHHLISQKFKDPVLKQKLIDTGSRYLEETNHWGDKFWGVCCKSGEGQNHLGKILMRVRSGDVRNSITD